MKNITCVSSSAFRWDPEYGILGAEHSDLGSANLWCRLWDDACDTGFQIKSERTGDVITVYCTNHVMNDDEVGGWEFKVIDSDITKNPKLEELSIKVWND